MKVGVDVKDEPRAGRGEGLRTSVVRRLWDVWSDTGRKARAPSCVLILEQGMPLLPPAAVRLPAKRRGVRCGCFSSLARPSTVNSHLAARISHLAGLSAPLSKRPLGLQSWAHLEGRPASPIGSQPEGCSPSVQPSTLFSWDVSQSRVPIQAHDGEGGLLMRDAQKRA
jgi:hypothetical protein